MPEHIRLNQGNDIASVVALLKNVQKMSSRQQTSNSGSFFIPADDEWEPDEEDSSYGADSRPGIVTGDSAADFGGIARKNKNGELEPLVDTESITNEVNEAKQNAQSAVDSAVNALTTANSASQAAGSASDVANAANANSTEAKSVATQAVATANSANQAATSAQTAANLALANAQELVKNGNVNSDASYWTLSGASYESSESALTYDGSPSDAKYKIVFSQPLTDYAVNYDRVFKASVDLKQRWSGAGEWRVEILEGGPYSFDISNNDIPSDSYKTFSGYIKIPAGKKMLQFFMRVGPTASDGGWYAKNMSLKDVTEVKAAQKAAENAQATADNAQVAADNVKVLASTAQSAAVAAQTTADEKNKVVRSASAPSSTSGYSAGDQWWVYGDVANDSTLTTAWTGTPNASTSTLSQDGAVIATNLLMTPRNNTGRTTVTQTADGFTITTNTTYTGYGDDHAPYLKNTVVGETYHFHAETDDVLTTTLPNSSVWVDGFDVSGGFSNTYLLSPSVIDKDITAIAIDYAHRFSFKCGMTAGDHVTWRRIGLYTAADWNAMQALGVDWFSGDAIKRATIIGLYIFNGSRWVSQTLTNSVMSSLDAGKITSGYVDADRIQSGSITGEKIADEVNQSISDAASAANTAQSTADTAKSIAETNATDLATFINETTDNLSSLQSQVDGSITTWFYDVAPTTSNKPASDWTTTDMKNNHLGDLYYDTDTGYCYRWQVASNTYSWSRISDVDVTKALSDAAAAQDTADSKRRVFTGTPSTPYDVGDLWVQGSSGDILTCSTAKTGSQSYNASDWTNASKYTDDTLAGQANKAAATAQESANTAQSAASTAQSSADAAKTAAESAQTTANAAVANAGTALTNANQALARATNITTGPTAPTQNVETGDVWFPTNTAGNVIGMKTWGGSAWTDVQLMAGSVLVPGSIGSTVIADGAITTPKLTITEEMVAELLKAKKIEAGDIDLNTLNGQTINGLVINGATVRTASSGTRVEISNYKPDMEGSLDSGAVQFFNSQGSIVGLISVDENGLLNIMTGQFDADGKPDPEYYANITNVFGTLTLVAKNGVSFSTGGGQLDFMRDGTLYLNQSMYINNNEVASQSGWVNLGYGSGYKKQSFGHVPRIMRMGNVVFAQGTALKNKGNIAADDHPFGTIPVGYRPDATQYATVTCAGNYMANIQINTNGTINLKGAPTGGTPWLTLDSCVWQTTDSFPTS